MSPRKANHPTGPSREELAAYADRELAGAAHARVRDWIASHPDAAAEVAAQRRLDRLYQATAPVEPNEPTWNGVLNRIEQGAAARPRRSTRTWPAQLGRILVPLTAAAAVFLVVGLAPVGRHQPQPERVEPYPVASADDVEIISLADADQRTILVGKSPLFEPIVLGRPDDMSDLDIKPDTDGMVPSIRPIEGGSVVIVAPLGWSGVDEKDP